MRKKAAKIRDVKEDPIYKNRLVTKLINRSMRSGKRSVAGGQVYRAFEKIAKDTGEDPLRIFLKAIENVKPDTEVRSRRIGGAAYQVPIAVRGIRKESLAMRWLVLAAGARKGAQYKTYADRLASEITDASRGQGGAVSKRQEIERIAEANKAFAHFRW